MAYTRRFSVSCRCSIGRNHQNNKIDYKILQNVRIWYKNFLVELVEYVLCKKMYRYLYCGSINLTILWGFTSSVSKQFCDC